MNTELSKPEGVEELNKKIQLLEDEISVKSVLIDLKGYSIDLLEEHLRFEKNMDRYLNDIDDLEFYVNQEHRDEHIDELKELKNRMDKIEENRSFKNALFYRRYAGIPEGKSE